jgi:hypothetical protein
MPHFPSYIDNVGKCTHALQNDQVKVMMQGRCRKLFDHACERLPLGMHANITATMVCDHSDKELSAEEGVLLALEKGLPIHEPADNALRYFL